MLTRIYSGDFNSAKERIRRWLETSKQSLATKSELRSFKREIEAHADSRELKELVDQVIGYVEIKNIEQYQLALNSLLFRLGH